MSKPQKSEDRMEILRSYIDLMGEKNIREDIIATMTSEMKDNWEKLAADMTYPVFLEKALPVFLKIVTTGEPCITKEFNPNIARNKILLILDRLPYNECTKQRVPDIIGACLEVVQRDNEENALIALRIIHKLYAKLTPNLDKNVIKIMDFIRGVCSRIPDLYPTMLRPMDFMQSKLNTTTRIAHLKTQSHFVAHIMVVKEANKLPYEMTFLPRSQQSLRVYQELPRLTMQLSQIYGMHLHSHIVQLIPSMIGILQMSASIPKCNIGNIILAREVSRLQARTLSFLGVILPTYHEDMASLQASLVQGAVNALIDVPPRCACERREMVAALRLFAAPLTAHWLLPVIPQLCSERNILGTGYTNHQTMRPLYYNFLGNLLLDVAHSVDLKSLTVSVQVFMVALLDDSLPHRINALCCQILTALVAPAAKASRNDLLYKILYVFSLCLKKVFKTKMPRILNASKRAKITSPAGPFEQLSCLMEVDKPEYTIAPLSEEDLAERRAMIVELSVGLNAVTAANPPCIGVPGCKNIPGNLKATLSGLKWAIRGLAHFTDDKAAETTWKEQGSKILDQLTAVVSEHYELR